MDDLAAVKVHLFTCHVNGLLSAGDQLHFDTAESFVEDGPVFKAIVNIEVGVQIVINAPQNILVELCRDTALVVIGGQQPLSIFYQVGA